MNQLIHFPETSGYESMNFIWQSKSTTWINKWLKGFQNWSTYERVIGSQRCHTNCQKPCTSKVKYGIVILSHKLLPLEKLVRPCMMLNRTKSNHFRVVAKFVHGNKRVRVLDLPVASAQLRSPVMNEYICREKLLRSEDYCGVCWRMTLSDSFTSQLNGAVRKMHSNPHTPIISFHVPSASFCCVSHFNRSLTLRWPSHVWTMMLHPSPVTFIGNWTGAKSRILRSNIYWMAYSH